MDHAFTDDQIIDAKHAAARHMSRDWISRFNLRDVRAILDALPEPDQQDDWQACEFADIRKGDRVKRIFTKVSGSKITKEGVAEHLVDGSIWSTSCGMRLASNNYVPHETGLVTLYRIPAPVTHPDPAECPVIIVHKALAYDFTQTPDGGQAMMWNGDTYENADYEFFCKDITDWTPAKVTPLED